MPLICQLHVDLIEGHVTSYTLHRLTGFLSIVQYSSVASPAFFIDFVSPDPDVYESERVYRFCLMHNRTCPDAFSVPVVNMQSGDDPAGG